MTDLCSVTGHSIHHGLESTNNVEVDAAIFAAGCLCKHSPTFAAGVCDKITSMVQGEDLVALPRPPQWLSVGLAILKHNRCVCISTRDVQWASVLASM